MKQVVTEQKASGINLGYYEDAHSGSNSLNTINYDEDGHLLTLAPTGSGKGTGCIIPTLLSSEGSAIVIDPKGEAAMVTSARRSEMGHDTYIIDPFMMVAEATDSINFLDLIDTNSETAVDDAIMLASLIRQGRTAVKDPFWDERAEALIAGLILHVAISAPTALKNLSEVLYLINQNTKDLSFTMKEMSKSHNPYVKQAANILDPIDTRQSDSIRSVAQNHINFMRGPLIERASTRTSIDVEGLQNGKKVTIYLILPPDKLASHSRLLRLWIGFLFSVLMRRKTIPAQPTLFMLDEAAQLGTFEPLRQAITLLRGYGVQTWSFWQDMSQIKNLYPNDWETLINNCAVIQAFGPTNFKVAQVMADVTGFPDVNRLYQMRKDEQIVSMVREPAKLLKRPNYLADKKYEGNFRPNPFYLGQEKPSLSLILEMGGKAS